MNTSMASKVFLYPTTRRQTATTIYGSWINVQFLQEVLLALVVTAQGAYTNETLDVTVQGQDAYGNVLTLSQFTQVGNVTASLPYSESIKLANFGEKIRAKIVTAGTAVDYTLSVSGFGK